LEEVVSGYITEYNGDVKALDYPAQDPGIFLGALNDDSLYRNIIPPPASLRGSLCLLFC